MGLFYTLPKNYFLLIEFMDLFDVHFALFEAAEKAGLTLDMSEHENKVEGLPFNLDFILRKQNQ